MTDEMKKKLEECFKRSYTDEEACITVDLKPRTLYDYCSKHPEWGKRKEMLKKIPNVGAKNVRIDKIEEKNYTASKDWLERKCKDEFSLRVDTVETKKMEVHSVVDIDKKSLDELKEVIKKQIDSSDENKKVVDGVDKGNV